MIRKINKKKHKALEEQYDHYVCEFCMEIGAQEVISEFVEDVLMIINGFDPEVIEKKWKKRKDK